ncbi:MAG: SDR family oxidoreductase [Alkalispirochaetaceae bacterium]
MRNIDGNVAIVTGASSGIGRATAGALARAGVKVVCAARNGERLDSLVAAVRAEGGEALAQPTDLTDPKQCHAMVQRAVEEYGTLDILINNAGISMRALVEEVEMSTLRRVMEVNFWGTVQATKAALPYLRKSRGVVLAVSSVAGFHGLPGRSGYSASKFAIHGFMESVRIENLDIGLQVTIVAPGFTASEIRSHALTADGTEQAETPLNEAKLMSAERVANLIVQAIRKGKRNKIISFEAQVIALMQRILPLWIDRKIYKSMADEPGSPLRNRHQ